MKSPLDELRESMKNDKWYIKLARYIRVRWWFLKCDIRYYFKQIKEE
jgi:hypothetical protein